LAITGTPSIERWGPEAKPTTLFQRGAEAVGFLVFEPAVLFRPVSEKLLQLPKTLGTLRVDRSVPKRFNVDGLALLENDMPIKDDDAVLHVPGVRLLSAFGWIHTDIIPEASRGLNTDQTRKKSAATFIRVSSAFNPWLKVGATEPLFRILTE
jgi:hypothetical protein